MNFRLRGLPAAPFTPLFQLDDHALAARKVVRTRADRPNGFPCRISLTDADVGTEVLLLNYVHHDVASPFHSQFAIYIREGEQQFDTVDVVPDQLRRRVLSLRGYDSRGMMTTSRLVDGREFEQAASALLDNEATDYVHVHFAAAGCYAARLDRVG